MSPTLRLVGDIVCAVVVIAAAVTDLRSRRIPDWLTLPAIAFGLIASMAGGIYHAAASATAVVLLGGLFAMVAAVGGLQWGDVKLMAAVGALLGWPLQHWPLVLHALFYTAMAGGLVGMAVALKKGRVGAVLTGTVSLVRRKKEGKKKGSGVSIPYGVAICLGTLWAIAGRYAHGLLVF